MEEFNTIVDFLENDRFRQWLKTQDAEATLYWSKWLENNPSKRHLFETAVASYRALEGGTLPVNDIVIAGRVNRIKESLPDDEQTSPVSWLHRPMMGWAAVLIATLLIGGLFWLRQASVRTNSGQSVAESRKTTLPENLLVVVRNTNSQPLLLNLPDNSSVLLAKNSSLEYINDPGKFNREVKLTGEGFFEVVKNPSHPFYVHTSLFTTKVLGTSFLIRSFENEEKATVRVRTGKVQITSLPVKPAGEGGSQDQEKVESVKTLLLLPNEQASLVRKTAALVRETEAPEKVTNKPELFDVRHFSFRFTPVNEVFDQLEKTYGTIILYDKDKFKNCTLTADLTDEPFLEKLRLICVSTEAHFEVSEAGITISGPGCH